MTTSDSLMLSLSTHLNSNLHVFQLVSELVVILCNSLKEDYIQANSYNGKHFKLHYIYIICSFKFKVAALV